MLWRARPSKCAWSFSPLISGESLSLLKANILIWSRNCWGCCKGNDMNIYGTEVEKGIKKIKFLLTFLCSFPSLLSIFLWKLSLLVAFSRQGIVTYGLSNWRVGTQESDAGCVATLGVEGFFEDSRKKCEGCPPSRNRASAHWQRTGLGQERLVGYIWVWNKED